METKNSAILLISAYFKLRGTLTMQVTIRHIDIWTRFFGLGWRDGFDTNRFVTANIVPFETDGTFPD